MMKQSTRDALILFLLVTQNNTLRENSVNQQLLYSSSVSLNKHRPDAFVGTTFKHGIPQKIKDKLI